MHRFRMMIMAAPFAMATTSIFATQPEDFSRGLVYQVERDESVATCSEWENGRPIGLWGNSGMYGDESEEIIRGGDALVVSAVHEDSKRAVRYFFFKDKAKCEFSKDRIEAEYVKSKAPVHKEQKLTRIAYLHKKYSSKIHYDSVDARNVVNAFDIDCRTSDRRYLPLVNILLSRIASTQREDLWMESIVEKRGDEVRVFDQIKKKDGSVSKPMLAVQINQWGDLKTYGFSAEAVYNSCFDGPSGRLWVSAGK